jgi:hypothetical protein
MLAESKVSIVVQLTGEEFVRRYLLYVLPKDFARIQHYGFLAGCCYSEPLSIKRITATTHVYQGKNWGLEMTESPV